MEYPLIIGGEVRGRLRVEQEGLYTVFEADAPGLHEGLHRIWIHGEGRSVYLGLLQPWSGGMYLRKKLSKSAMESIPQIVERVTDKEREWAEILPQPEENSEPEAPSCPYPAPVSGEDELQWFKRPDGSLVAHDGLSSIVALPSSLRGEKHGAVLKNIAGREYILFRY